MIVCASGMPGLDCLGSVVVAALLHCLPPQAQAEWRHGRRVAWKCITLSTLCAFQSRLARSHHGLQQRCAAACTLMGARYGLRCPCGHHDAADRAATTMSRAAQPLTLAQRRLLARKHHRPPILQSHACACGVSARLAQRTHARVARGSLMKRAAPAPAPAPEQRPPLLRLPPHGWSRRAAHKSPGTRHSAHSLARLPCRQTHPHARACARATRPRPQSVPRAPPSAKSRSCLCGRTSGCALQDARPARRALAQGTSSLLRRTAVQRRGAVLGRLR